MPVSPANKPVINDELVTKTIAEIDRILTYEPMGPQESGTRVSKRMSGSGWYLRLEVRTDGALSLNERRCIEGQYVAAGWNTFSLENRKDDDGFYAVVKLTEIKANPVDVDEEPDDAVDDEDFDSDEPEADDGEG